MYIAIPVNGGLDQFTDDDIKKIQTTFEPQVITKIKSQELYDDLKIKDLKIGIKVEENGKRTDCYFRQDIEVVVKDSDSEEMANIARILLGRISIAISKELRPGNPDSIGNVDSSNFGDVVGKEIGSPTGNVTININGPVGRDIKFGDVVSGTKTTSSTGNQGSWISSTVIKAVVGGIATVVITQVINYVVTVLLNN